MYTLVGRDGWGGVGCDRAGGGLYVSPAGCLVLWHNH